MIHIPDDQKKRLSDENIVYTVLNEANGHTRFQKDGVRLDVYLSRPLNTTWVNIDNKEKGKFTLFNAESVVGWFNFNKNRTILAAQKNEDKYVDALNIIAVQVKKVKSSNPLTKYNQLQNLYVMVKDKLKYLGIDTD